MLKNEFTPVFSILIQLQGFFILPFSFLCLLLSSPALGNMTPIIPNVMMRAHDYSNTLIKRWNWLIKKTIKSVHWLFSLAFSVAGIKA